MGSIETDVSSRSAYLVPAIIKNLQKKTFLVVDKKRSEYVRRAGVILRHIVDNFICCTLELI